MLKASRFASLLFNTVNAGLACAHAVEMAPKRELDGREFLAAQRLYRNFGKVSRLTFPGALLSTAATLLLVRDRREIAGLTAFAGGCTLATIAVWLLLNEPVNREVVTWEPEGLPADWESRRDQWEYAHATSAALHSAGLTALVAATLRDT